MLSRPPRLIRKFWRSFQALIQAISALFLRSLFLPVKKKAGFVLPTATLVLLVVSLLVGTLVVRTGQEAEEAIREQAQQKIYNAATPAVDRAKAKIEFLFQQDKGNRAPGTIPSEQVLNSMMLNDGEEVEARDSDPYTFDDEDRLKINGNSVNAWEYQIDSDGDGETETAVRYSVTLLSEAEGEGGEIVDINSDPADKANNLVVRSGALNAGPTNNDLACQQITQLDISDGWYTITGSTFRKNFQINAVVDNNNEANKAVSTLEVQQDRDLNTGNKWGAWYRYDLELTPFPDFNWNGAMHTDGSLILNNNGDSETYLRLVSAPESCLYTREASQITMGTKVCPEGDDSCNEGDTTYQGQLMRVDTNNDEFEEGKDDQVRVDLFPGPDEAPTDGNNSLRLEVAEEATEEKSPEDSVTPDKSPSQYMLDPVELVSAGEFQARNTDDRTNTKVRDEDWEDNPIRDRIDNGSAEQPFVDDTYRADDRWGPKAKYNDSDQFEVTAENNGTLITGEDGLTRAPTSEEPENAGLDGYWERRADFEGMRIIMGQRLNLSNNEVRLDDPDGMGNNFDTYGDDEDDDVYVPVRVKDGTLTIRPQTKGEKGDSAKIAYIEFQDYTLPTGSRGINFEASGGVASSDFESDTGEGYGDRGGDLKYGWFSDVPETANEINDIIEDDDEYEDISTVQEAKKTIAQENAFDNTGAARDRDGTKKGSHNQMDGDDTNLNLNWQIDVPNGTYRLDIGMGDSSNTDQENSIVLEPNGPLTDMDMPFAVQAGAIYHWDGHRDTPAACMALTGHPNNDDATVFDEITVDGTTYIETDFLNKRGTNGWEFPFYGDLSKFKGDINSDTTILRQALNNLAHFAGDPNGAFPPNQDDSSDADAVTHPYPELTKWGNFSNLRRAIDQLEDGDSYSDLSLADQTTLQTATCTLGMLAHNLKVKEKEFSQSLDNGDNLQSEGVNISKLVNGKCNPVIIDPSLYGEDSCEDALFDGEEWENEEGNLEEWEDTIDNSESNNNKDSISGCENDDLSKFDPGCDEPQVYRLFTSDQLLKEAGFNEKDEREALTSKVEKILQGSQIERDRKHGFAIGGAPTPDIIEGALPYNAETGLAGPAQVEDNKNVTFRAGCDPDVFTNFVAKGKGKGSNERAKIGLSLAYCQDVSEPKYPSLFYLFPIDAHDHNGDPSDDNEQPNLESYIADEYIFDDSGSGTPTGVNGDYIYESLTQADIESLALTPRPEDSLVLPTSNTDTGIGNEITKPDGTNLYVPFLDKAIYDDREKMDVRLLNIDLNLLRENTTDGGDYWLPTGDTDRDVGIVYAFREDALREDGIARPNDGDWGTCGTEENLTGLDNNGDVLSNLSTSNTCRMRLSGLTQDPPLNSNTGVSAKPVDSYADPDRRPYGFRLRNGNDISRSDSDPTGLSFITDQPVYIQGDFNQHLDNNEDEDPIEEFTDKLKDNNFYKRETLDENFATPSGENWRPTEILADGITLLSPGFDLLSSDFTGPAEKEDVQPAPTANIEVNSIFVSAIIPTLPKQYNGGLHNLPRFLENWSELGGENVRIRGSFIQLNFSKYATGPWDQEDTNSDSPSNLIDNVNLPHYQAPERNWGYDVGLQYNPPSPVAKRFVSSESPRTETYRELPADDPYIQNLLNASSSNE